MHSGCGIPMYMILHGWNSCIINWLFFSSLTDLRVRHRWTLHEDLCYHWLVDECSWPQCNRACPRLHDPFTGEELDFIELLKSFGLDMASVASALGIDMVTLNDMDHDTLLQMLTQQTNWILKCWSQNLKPVKKDKICRPYRSILNSIWLHILF